MATSVETTFNPHVDYYPPTLLAKHGIQLSGNTAVVEVRHSTADIGWVPELAKFHQRTSLRNRDILRNAQVPKGWPKAVLHPLAWTGSELKPEDYAYDLSAVDINEIKTALSHFKSSGLELHEVRKKTFPLPLLGPRLEGFCKNVYDGKGFCVVRGLDPDSFSREDNTILYLGVSSYFGEQRGRQYQNGSMMAHITDVKFDDIPNDERRPLFTNISQPFHTDLLCGILAMYVLNKAAIGGNILLASSWTVYNEIASEHPDLIAELTKSEWVHDTFGRNPGYYCRPLLHYWKDRLALVFSRRNLTGSLVTPRSPDIPPMTDAQAEALDAVHFTAAANCITLEPKRGDMLFINNLAILHSRSSFEDSPESKRYILRLWLNNPELGWDVPPKLKLAWDRIFAKLSEINDHWDIDPYHDESGWQSDKAKSSHNESRGRKPRTNGRGKYFRTSSCG